MADDRAAQFEELRFAKRQQWAIATAAVTLLAAVFGIARTTKVDTVEKAFATIFVVLIASFGIAFLHQLQGHLSRVRIALDPNDADPWFRGVDILRVLAGIVFFS